MPADADPMIEALLAERAGYTARGMDARAALVDEQLALLGHPPAGEGGPIETTMAEGGPERAVPPRGRPRRGG